jgi:chromosome segregation ATPase
MAKDGKRKKVKTKSSTKYETSSDEDNASDEEDNLRTLFANLNMQQKEKLNELISAIHEKDDLLDSQEDFLIKENKKHVKVKNAYALEVEKYEKLSSELSTCHDVITNLRNENASLIAKVDSNVCDDSISNLRDDNANLLARIEKLNDSLTSLKIENENFIAKAKNLDVCNVTISDLRDNSDILRAKIVELNSCKPSTSTIEHVTICTRCRDNNIDAIHDHMALIKQQNDHIAKLDAKITEHDLENEKFKFARSMLYSGRRPGIKDGFGFLKDCPTLLRARLPCLRITRDTFCTLPVIPRARLGEFILGSLTLALIMLLCIRVRHLVLGNQLVQNCLRRKLLLHQMIITFHLKLLMHLMF